jgi:citrate synthase
LVNQHIAVSRRIVPDHLDADAAVRLLGVQKATLYAYVSRGLVRASPGADGRRRLYDRSDLERLRARHDARSGHGPTAAAALRFGEPVLASALTRIDPVEGPLYRGRAATAWAAEGASLERVSEHLWAAAPDPAAWTRALRGAARAGPRYAAALPRHSQVHARMAALLTRAALDDDARLDATPARELLRGRVLMHLLVHALEPARSSPRSRRAPAPPPPARCRRSPRLADPERAGRGWQHRARAGRRRRAGADGRSRAQRLQLCGARRGLDGRRSVHVPHGRAGHGQRPRARQRARSCGGAGRRAPQRGAGARRAACPARAAARRCLASVTACISVATRAPPPMLAWAEALAPRSPVVRTLRGLVDAMADAGHAPTCDLGLVALSAALGLPRGSASALFALGRSAGWIAHALEQRGQGFLLRPRARYVGP